MVDAGRLAVAWLRSIVLLIPVAACAGAAAGEAQQQRLADAIVAAMEKHAVPGAGIAVIDGYTIDWAAGFGKLAVDGEEKVMPETLFQAASISKPVAAAGALVLVQEGKLDLEADVNAVLKGWLVPDGAMTPKDPIRLRHVLSHTAGLTVHGFAGYATDAKCPTLVEILDGHEPANSAAIRSFLRPGYMFRYSGGGYCVLQQLVIDTTGAPFPQFMQSRVLAPLGMTHSTYEQPLPESHAAQAARGHRPKKAVVAGRWHVHPEMAAAGLWTTPSDLALFAIDLAKSYAGKQGRLLTQETARRMLTVEKGTYGLGLSLRGEGQSLEFSHGGSNVGYRCLLVAYPMTGQGLAIMTNSDTGGAMFNDLVKLAAELYGWPGK